MRKLGWVLICFLAASYVLFQGYADNEDVEADNTVLDKWSTYFPLVISPSPDGESVLKRVLYDAATPNGSYGFEVIDVSSKQRTHLLESKGRLLRAVWRGDSRAIVYFRQEKDSRERKLFVWDLDKDSQLNIPIPLSYSEPHVSWSPDGNYIAYLSDVSSPSGGLFVVDIVKKQVFSYRDNVKAFDWSDDSSRIAVISSEEEHQKLCILNSSCLIEEKHTLNFDNISEVHWRDANDLLVLSQKGESATSPIFYEIARVSESGLSKGILFRSETKVEGLRWIPGEKGILWHSPNFDSIQDIYILKKDQLKPIRLTDGGGNHFRSFSDDATAVNFIHITQSEHKLLRREIDNSNISFELAGNEGTDMPGLVHETIRIKSADGALVPLLLSRVPEDRTKHAAFIRFHPTPQILDLDRWAETQLQLDYGVHVLHVGGREGHWVDDLLAACYYAQEVLGVPTSRIVLRGDSSAANLVVESVIRDPACAGIIAIVGFTANARKSARIVPHLKVLAFQGELDAFLDPKSAFNHLRNLFGERALESPFGIAEMLPNEPHWILYHRSHARIQSKILEALSIQKD